MILGSRSTIRDGSWDDYSQWYDMSLSKKIELNRIDSQLVQSVAIPRLEIMIDQKI